MGTGLLNWIKGVFAITAKDVRSEFRGRAAMSAVLLFAVVSLTVVSYSIGGFGISPEVQASLLWVVLFFAAMAGLSRSFVVEAERGTQIALRLSATGGQVYLGKLLFNLLLLGVLDIVVICLFQILLPIGEADWPLLVVALTVGSMGLGIASTLIAAIVAQAGVRGALFTVLAFPVLVPVLIGGIGATRKALALETIGSAAPELQLLVSYSGIMLTLALLLFDFVWRD